MTDTAGYPVAQQAYPVAPVPAAIVAPRALTPAEQEQCDALYVELKPMATDSARQYVLARTPANLQEAMTAKIDADWPAPPPLSREESESRRRDADSAFRPAQPTPPPTQLPADPTVGQPFYPRSPVA